MDSQPGAVNVVILSLSLWLPCFSIGKLLLYPTKIYSCISSFPDVLHDPENTTAFLDQSAVFKCETTGGITSWIINGTLIELLPPEIHRDLSETGINTPIGTRLENLTIPARAEYNATRVQCVVFTANGLSVVESENATFYIQGITLHLEYKI